MKNLRHSLWFLPLLIFVLIGACQPDRKQEDELIILPRQDGGLLTTETQAPRESPQPTEPTIDTPQLIPDTPQVLQDQTKPEVTQPEPKIENHVNPEPPLPDALPPEPQLRPSVRILEPTDGSDVTNPVTFKITAKDVHQVELFSGVTSLGAAWDPKTKNTLTYTFKQTNQDHTIQLKGYDTSNQEVAQVTIKIRVKQPPNQDKGKYVAKMYITYYYLSLESDYSGSPTTALYDKNCKVIKKVPAKFVSAVDIEGSGRLTDGRVINYEKRCTCGGRRRICYKVLNKTKYPWGLGSRSNALKPLRSLAVDRRVIAIGTKLYMPEWDGVKIPSLDGIGGFTHDGCFQADDVGGAIKGKHFDFFSGTKKMWKVLGKIHPTRKYLTVYRNPGRCP